MVDDTQFPAPNAALLTEAGEHLKLDSLRGAPFVLFFYPRDNTPGCTTEAKGFSEHLPTFEALGVQVFGVSKDSLASHEKFRIKQELNVPLLSDEHSDACEAFGVWKEKNMYGKKFMGIERSTFLINADGQVVRSWRKVKVDGHVEDVLEAVKALTDGATDGATDG
ncbi:peroxiredoxin [Lentibacter algarum]|uniref:peroxiredoxin n=1 Tax=Lentibacter algarum TaxID=576131 RepID=UPI001C0943D9|nr:peroxiredoxin [Lentibacter algarum]MBU2982551.1 peroxiredoxin [Lentibacter algarum]